MTIRKATADDAHLIAPLFNNYRMFYKERSDVDGAFNFIKERLQNQESVIFIACIQATVAGFVQLYPVFSSTKMKRAWILNDLYVSEDFRSQRIGKALLAEAKKNCIDTGACEMVLETSKSNNIGNNLYPKTGFILDTEFNHYVWRV